MAMNIGRKQFQAEINVTPMIDVLLVLLVIFMIVSPLKPHGLPALVPQPNPAPAPPVNLADLVLTVKLDGGLLLNQEAVTLEKLPARLADLARVRGDLPIFVRGDRDLNFRQVAQVMDIARGAGMRKVALMTTNAG